MLIIYPHTAKMVGPSPSHHIFSIKTSPPSSPSSSSTISCSSMKLKTLLQTFIFSHLYRIARALTKAKSILAELLKDIHLLHLLELPVMMMKKNRNKNKLFFGSFRLHYNWCSSHVMPMPTPNVRESFTSTNYLYYDSSWNSMVSTECDSTDDDDQSSELSGYLQWLEEKAAQQDSSGTGNDINEIDRLADKFIASCHEKFRLEKQESYRRFQEMMARSV